MSRTIDEDGFKYRINFERIEPLAQSIRPGLKVTLTINYLGPGTLAFFEPKTRVYMRGGYGERIIGEGVTLNSFGEIRQSGQANWDFNIHLNYVALKRIEEFREAGDLDLEFKGSFIGEMVSNRPKKKLLTFDTVYAEIAKSNWVEKFLRQLKFKDVKLVEFPKINGFTNIVNHLDAAWKQYSMGNYDNTFVHCRKALESLITEFETRELMKEIMESGKPKTVTDWEKIIGTPKTGKIIRKMFQQTKNFVAPGAHAGKAINREDADFALLTTNAIVDISIKKLPIRRKE